jgi:hypothetical protein
MPIWASGRTNGAGEEIAMLDRPPVRALDVGMGLRPPNWIIAAVLAIAIIAVVLLLAR